MRNIRTVAVDPFNRAIGQDRELLKSTINSLVACEPVNLEFELVHHTHNITRTHMSPMLPHGILNIVCEIGDIRRVETTSISSYTEIGIPNFIDGERVSTGLHNYTWFAEIILPLGFSEEDNKTASFLRIRNPSILYDPESLRPKHRSADIHVVEDIRYIDSNYLYYTLLI
jgi:hypothetical protein